MLVKGLRSVAVINGVKNLNLGIKNHQLPHPQLTSTIDGKKIRIGNGNQWLTTILLPRLKRVFSD
ncbi:hypothetical protein SBF1_310039 [Candidatus Desulfosporosinus infrequens]|uniref:Uncharacterized protein n=1 Tax=Candidatus Desulfosporosinus infrequens TaxID=2043169 RepID=A0A2U3KXZ1_9FIRM|nr:hypothetical protein SBF1_310039 [Candidatus Desulfosporosinus infrequens]